MAEQRKAQDQDKVMVRLPDGMRNEIKAAAKAGRRSANAEIVARLSETFGAMSVRDWFAGQALVAIADDCGMSDAEIAQRCYERADAMLAERQKAGA